jgi:drug/metabolite transporter (DMT)-like permease
MKTWLYPEIIFFYLNAGLFYFADILQKITSEKKWTWGYLTIRTTYTFLIAFVLTAFYAGFQTFPDYSIALQIAGCSVICGGGLFFYIRAVNHLKFSNAGSLYIIGNVLQALTGILLFNEPFHWIDLPAFLLMSSGCIYQLFAGSSFKGAVSVLLSTLCWTFGYILLSFPLKQANVFWSIPLMEGTILIICLGVIWWNRNKYKTDVKEITQTTNPMRFIGIGLLVTAGSYFNNLSFRENPLSLISILQLSVMPITLLLSLRIFRETLTKVEWISFAAGFTGFAMYVLNRI